MERTWSIVRAVSRLPAIGIDVGASKVVAAVVEADGTIAHRIDRTRTPDSNNTGLVEALGRAVQSVLVTAPEVSAVGVGTAGLVKWPEGDIEFAANHGHRRLKLRRNLEDLCGLPVVVDNDANAAAWAEATAGEYPDQSLLFLAVGTGLGSGFVMDGQLMRGHHGRGAELGHVVVDRESQEKCSCGLIGCLEALASGRALERAGRRIVNMKPDNQLAKRAKRADAVTTALMIDAALHGDPDVLAVVRSMGSLLGKAIAENAMSLLPVDRVVVGGGLAALGRMLLDPMRQACDKALARSRCYQAPRITLAHHGKDAILVGAALLATAEAAARDKRAKVAGPDAGGEALPHASSPSSHLAGV